MSMFLARRMLKLSGIGKSLCQTRQGIRLLMTTTTSSLSSSPYLMLSMNDIRDHSDGNRDKIANFNLYDPKEQKRVTMAEKRIPESIHLSRNIGASRGWVFQMNEEDLTVHLTNIFNPSAPESTHTVIYLPILLPPYTAPDISQSEAALQVLNVSLSSSPDNLDDQDCIVAVKFRGSCISFYRMGDSRWHHADSLSSRFDDSVVVYSSKDSTFYLTPPTDTFFRKDARNMPEPNVPFLTYYRQLGPLKQPKMGEYEYELLRRCTRTKRLVESPSGDFFIIVNYALHTCKGKPVFFWETEDLDHIEPKSGTRWFMLYRHDPATRVESYVQDIGDLCIFLGKNEPFCLSASMYPGLEPNSIYFTEGNQVYLYNIPDQTICQLSHDGLISDLWLQPILHE